MVYSDAFTRRVLLCFFTLAVMLFRMNSQAQSLNQNYIRVRTPRLALANVTDVDTTTFKQVQFNYFDGLGRPLQTVNQKATPSSTDLITPRAFDAAGREARSYLPFSDGTADGSYRPAGLSQQATYYSTPATQTTGHIAISPFPFSDVGYEPSPLNRTAEVGAPGAAWQLGGHTVKTVYGVNGAATILNWTISGTTVTASTNYAIGTLFSTIITDGNNNVSTQYKDFKGSVILSVDPLPTGAGANDSYQTYSVYNDLDQLAYVITPGAMRQMASAGSYSFTEAATNVTFAEHIYCYHYDLRGRVIARKQPGKDWEYLIYNALDELVLTQDGNLRNNTAGTGSASSWRFNKYDALKRLIQTGIYVNSAVTDPVALQVSVNQNYGIYGETRSGAVYTNNAFPQQSYTTASAPLQVLTTLYYDDYTFLGGTKGYATGTYAPGASAKTISTSTGSSVAILGTTTNLISATYFDNLDNPIQQVADNQAGSQNLTNFQYNFNNQNVLTSSSYTEGSYVIAATTRYGMDKMGRKTDTYEKISGDPEAQLSHVTYNDLGQAIKKSLHATDYVAGTSAGTKFLQGVDARYTIRGWLSSINNASLTNDGNINTDSNDLYGEELTYNDSTSLGAMQWNGNISGVKWQNQTSTLPANMAAYAVAGQQGYAFSYDQDNRLNLGQYASLSGSTWSLNTKGTIGKSSEKIAYDVMGNITALQRNDNAGGILNNFTYSYQNAGNKLAGINDAGTAAQTTAYTYDSNGNMLTDSKKGITITYNFLNLPATIVTANQTMTYGYDAIGRKLYKTVTGQGATRKDYIDALESTSGVPNFLHTEEGRVLHIAGKPYVTTSGVNYAYEYFLKDHLGNTRVTFSATSSVVNGYPTPSMIQDYYPYGSTVNPYINSDVNSNVNQYGYNGKEIQSEITNLNLYDYGARFFDPIIGRFTTIDPLADESEKASPYHAFADNPINTLDPTGLIDLPEVVVTAQAPEVPHFQDLQALSSIEIGQVTGGNNSGGQNQSTVEQLIPSNIANIDDNDPKRAKEKKDPMRGGGQKDRDRSIKRYPNKFQKWYHQDKKKHLDHGGDATPKELEQLYKDWLNLGQPSVSTVGTALSVAAGIGVYEGIKWSIAGLLAPETLGGALLGAAMLP